MHQDVTDAGPVIHETGGSIPPISPLPEEADHSENFAISADDVEI